MASVWGLYALGVVAASAAAYLAADRAYGRPGSWGWGRTVALGAPRGLDCGFDIVGQQKQAETCWVHQDLR